MDRRRRLLAVAVLAAACWGGAGCGSLAVDAGAAPTAVASNVPSAGPAGSATPAAPAAAGPADAFFAPPPALRLEGVPPLSRAVLDATRRYAGVSGHGFVDWHPQRREMLVAHRAPADTTTQLYRVRGPLAAPERLTDGADPVRQARWEPQQGALIVFARSRGGDEADLLYRLDPATRATAPITAAGQRHALLGWRRGDGPTAWAVVASVPLDRTAGGGTRAAVTTTLSLVDPLGDPASPASRRVVAELPGGGWFGGEVSPDRRLLALTRYVSAAESQVWTVDLDSGAAVQRLPTAGEALRASHFPAAWSPDGRGLWLTSDRDGEFRQAMRWSLDGGAPQRFGAATSWDQGWGSLSADGRRVALLVNVDGRDELQLLDAGSGAPVAPGAALPPGSLTQAEFHPAQPLLALTVNSTRGPSQIHVQDVERGSVGPWTQPAGTEGLALQTLPDQQVVRWRSFDGRTISGVLSLPPARFGTGRPVVMVMHGGPEGQSKLGWQGRTNYLLEQLGVAVLEPNVRGSSGYGKTFLALDNGRLREDSVRDMAAAIDWVATQPALDASRVVVVGGSYGGYMALAAATRLADRIAGAVSVVGISHFVTFLERTESYRRDLRRVEYGDERDPSMRAFLNDISPLTNADRIAKPLMVVQGRNDPRVPWTESEQIVRSLQRRGTPVSYLLADDEGHGFARRANSDAYFVAFVDFLRRTLKP